VQKGVLRGAFFVPAIYAIEVFSQLDSVRRNAAGRCKDVRDERASGKGGRAG
jgi:hypothetical protein